MNSDTFKGKWLQLKGQVRKQWGKLTDDDLDQIQGDTEILAGRLQERYGRSKEDVDREVDAAGQEARATRPVRTETSKHHYFSGGGMMKSWPSRTPYVGPSLR